MAIVGKHNVRSRDELGELARGVVKEVKAGDILTLQGPLGSGKTTFTQLLAASLGVREAVTSPTFTIMSEYEIHGHDDIDWLVHIDLYRLEEDRHDVDEQYISDVLESAATGRRLIVVEWPERLPRLTVRAGWRFEFEHGGSEDERIVTISRS